MSTRPRIGMVGIGLMGHGIASNIAKHGYPLTVLEHPGNQPLDALKAAGVTSEASTAALAAVCDIVLLCVTGTPQVEAVLLGEGGAWAYTPLFVVLVLIGVIDVIFAVDSIPAIFAITTDPFIVLTSNVFAVLGLRAMFFMLAGMADRFHLLPYGLAVVLVFIGAKMLMIDIYKIPVLWSLGVVAVILGVTVALSLARPPKSTPMTGG